MLLSWTDRRPSGKTGAGFFKAHLNTVGLMLGQRRRRWANIKPTVFQCVVFAGKAWPPRMVGNPGK